ncbi:purine-nucleoside phosphorylase [Bacillus piscicola]|uniref:purine-nucleoside phosphorylase n=1 Tax=Bacillus piscicola TaxID=1632684 RepID=UPI001F08ACA0|nr:purine-nucleoside phosphorylase [Bacillus piscicola]
MTTKRLLEDAVTKILSKTEVRPEVGLILGSGLGVLAEEFERPVKIPYEEVPGFPVSTVEGHAGQLVFGYLHDVPVVAMQGRFHFYEGYSLKEVTFPVRVMRALGVASLLVTNAAGSINPSFSSGELMLIRDHLNVLGANPLIGKNIDEWGTRFPDMSSAYSQRLRTIARKGSAALTVPLQEGVYASVTGPSYETPAEVKMLQKLGADAVGMSTVPEVIVAVHSGMEVLGISCLSNMAAGIVDTPLSHEEVIHTTKRVQHDFLQLMKEIVKRIGEERR